MPYPIKGECRNTGRTRFKKGNKGFWLGKNFSKETIEKLRVSHLGKPGYWIGKKRPNMTGENHPRWKGDFPKCLDCGKILNNKNAVRCKKCYDIFHSVGGLPKCVDCGKILSAYIYQNCRCKSCSRKGDKSTNWKGGISKKKGYQALCSGKRRAMENNAEGYHTLKEWELLKKQYGYKCPCCGKKEPEVKLTEDHIIPLIKGGSNYIENIQPLCRKCNSKKHVKIVTFTYDYD